jgi:site-specific DNA recombinase
MTPSFTLKNGVRYRFYVSSALLKGRKAEAGSVPRVSAPDIESAVFKGIRAKLNCDNLSSAQCIEQYVRRIVVHEGQLAATLKNADHIELVTLEISFKQRISGNRVCD